MKQRTKKRRRENTPAVSLPPRARPRELELFGPDPLSARIREWVAVLIEQIVAEELDAVLGAPRYGRGKRSGYRHTIKSREITTSLGPTKIRLQRARLFDDSGEPSIEWESKLLPRYVRRAPDVDNSILGAYLAGANSRRIRAALKPMLKEAPLSKSSVSRLMGHLQRTFTSWRTAPLQDKPIAYLYLDAIRVRVRTKLRVESAPVLVALGVQEDGEKELLGLMLMGSESGAAWGAFVDDLVSRGLRQPILCIIDGSAGARRAITAAWPGTQIQRCVVHKLRNLIAHAPRKCQDEVKADYLAITNALNLNSARRAHARFVAKWQKRCEGVVTSLLEAGDDLLTHYKFPLSQWRSIRSTNNIERLQGEFRRRMKTQAAFPTSRSVLYLFYGLYEAGHIKLRHIDGWFDMKKVIEQYRPEALQPAA